MEISIKWNICRVCLHEECKTDASASGGQMRNIFEDDKNLSKHIYECSGIVMKQNDSLPDKICHKCVSSLKHAISFRKSCRDSNEYLQSVIQRTKSASSMLKQQVRHRNKSSDEPLHNEEGNMEVLKMAGANQEQQPLAQKDVKSSFKRKLQSDVLQKCKKPKPAESPNESCNEAESDTEFSDREEHADALISQDEEEDEEIIAIAGDVIENHEEGIPLSQLNQESGSKVNNKNAPQFENILLDGNNEFNANTKRPYSDQNKLNYVDGEHILELNDIGEDDSNDIQEMQKLKSEEAENNILFTIHKQQHNKKEQSGTIEDSPQTDDDIVFLPLEEDEEDVEHDDAVSESHHTDTCNQSQVTSTVLTKEEIDLEDSNSSDHEINEEYIVDEYIIDECVDDVGSETSQSVKSEINITNYTLMRNVQSQRKKQGRRHKSSVSSARAASSTTLSSQPNFVVCEICGNHFNNRQIMNAHMKVHRQERSHECEICFKRFITACNLQAHMRIHTGEKPFKCKYCERRFTDRSTHLRHERIHTNEKPFLCEHCNKAFALSTTLQAHLKVHTGERPYKCEPCEKFFKLPHQLKAHKNTHLHRAVEQLTP